MSSETEPGIYVLILEQMSGLALKLIRLAPDVSNPGLFQITFQYSLTRRAIVLKFYMKMSLIGLILGQFDPLWSQI